MLSMAFISGLLDAAREDSSHKLRTATNLDYAQLKLPMIRGFQDALLNICKRIPTRQGRGVD